MKTKATLLLSVAFVSAFATSLFAGNGISPYFTPAAKQAFKMADGITEKDYLPKTIIIKLKPEFRGDASVNSIDVFSLQQIFGTLGVEQLGKIFPMHRPPEFSTNKAGQKTVDLSLIYEITYSNDISVEQAINLILADGKVIYAEPSYVYQQHYTPNDPNRTDPGQYFLTNIKAFQAWDIQKGDPNVVIGIVDSGTDWNHPDLAANVKTNAADPINGTDDDGDNYIDNFRGWDLGDNDNDPTVGNSNHGSHVSGCAAAVTDNNTGVASPGFKCKFLGVKANKNTDGTSITKGYPGIVYAADHGCQIINCSWGGPGGGSYGEDIINYATFNKNSLVVASAGNGSNQVLNFPGSFENALCVASTTSSDAKSGFSTYNYTVDVSAPGSSIYTTVYNDNYTSMSGTSMASPITAGACAIVKSHFPSYTGIQVGEQIRMTSDFIDNVSGNAAYKTKIGKGRINMYRALTESPISARATDFNFTDNNDNAFVINDTVRITCKYLNYLAATSNLTATLTAAVNGSYVTIINGSNTIGVLATNGSTTNNSNPFQVKINPSAPANGVVTFKLTLSDGTFTADQFFDLIVNVDYINVVINEVGTTISSKGRNAYSGDNQTQGLGFTYKDSNLVYECGLMIGVSATKVSDNVRNQNTTGTTIDNDFQSVVAVRKVIPTVKSEFDLYGQFNDNLAPSTSRLNVLVTHRSYAWSTPGDRKYVIVEYTIKNNGSSTLSSLYAGLFTDWDIWNFNNNKGAQDVANKLGYVYCTDSGGVYGGVRVLTNTPFVHYSIDNDATGQGGVNLSNGYGIDEKYTTLSTNRGTAGGTGTGNDIIDVVSTGPFNITVGDSVKVAFAILAGDDPTDLITSSKNADIKYNTPTFVPASAAKAEFALGEAYPNPSNGNVTIGFNLGSETNADLSIYNALGQKVMTVVNNNLAKGNHKFTFDVTGLPAGVYFYTLKAEGQSASGRMAVVR